MTMVSDGLVSFGSLLNKFRKRVSLTQQQLADAIGVHRHAIGRWEQGEILPASKAIVLELGRHLRLNDQEARQLLEASLTVPTPLWGVPVPRNLFFTGRKDTLEALNQHLSVKQASASSQVSALCGLGGVGKTQTALEYAYRYALEYRAIFWIEAETTECVLSSLQRIASLLGLPERTAPDQQRMVEAVQRWLATHNQWLLIWDNLEDLNLLDHFLPSNRQGALLLTTRHQALGTLARRIEISPMVDKEGILLLLLRAKLLEPGTVEAQAEQGRHLEAIKPAEYAAAAELVTLLGGLPLALDQVGAYLEETGCSLNGYLRRYQQQQAYLLARRGGPANGHPHSVTATFLLAKEQIERVEVGAADLLRLCAFLHAEAIPEELFTANAGHPEHVGPNLALLTTNLTNFDLTLGVLRNLSLIQRQAETRTISLHRLVQAVLREQMEAAEVQLWSERVIRLIHAVFPVGDFDTWECCERYLAQALACVPLSMAVEKVMPEASELFQRVEHYLLERGRFDEAKPLLEQAVLLGERQQGANHPVLIPHLTNLAELAWRQGDYARAEKLLSRVLVIEEHHRETIDSQTGETLNNLALLYWEQGKYAQAEKLLQEVLCLREKLFGPAHLETTDPLNNLGLLYWKQGKYGQAEPLYQRIVSIYEQELEQIHPQMAQVLSNLAVLYRDQGKYGQAELLFQQALQIQKQTSGSEHPQMAMILNGFAVLYRDQGKCVQAEQMVQQALQIQQQMLTPSHCQVALSLANLAALSMAQKNYVQAEQLFQQALQIQEQALGPDHPDTAATLGDLATLLTRQENDEQAEALYQRALQIQEQALGARHPQVARTLSGLANLAARQADNEQAKTLYQRALCIQEQCLDAGHLDLARTLAALTDIYEK